MHQHRLVHDAVDQTFGVVVVDEAGTAMFQSPAGASWLSALSGTGRSRLEAVLAAIARARTAPSGVSAIWTDSALVAVRFEASTADDASVALVCTPLTPSQRCAVPDAWDLTPAEARVVELALKGLSNAGIAERLYISPETARTHLRHAYEKAGVGSRNQLMTSYCGLLLNNDTPEQEL